MGFAYDAANRVVVLFGGWGGGGGYYGDTWSWDGRAWTLLEPPSHPSTRRSPGMVYDTRGERSFSSADTGVIGQVLNRL